MVTRRRDGRRGSSSLGCLVSLALFAIAVYYGVQIGQVYFRYYQLLDEMQSQARLADEISDDVIRQRLRARADDLMPGLVGRFQVRRTGRPPAITISTEYSERVELPFFDHTFVFRPSAREPL